MQFSHLLGGGTPTIKKYKSAAGHIAGIVLLAPASNATGVSVSTTTSWANSLGLSLDGNLSAGAPLAYSVVQGAVEYLQSVIVNPNAVYRALMVGSAVDAAVELRTVATASSNGLTAVNAVTDTDPSSPSMDEGTIWYTSGNNGGASRKITSVTTAVTTTVIMPFAANAVGDRYVTIPYHVGNVAGVTMGTNLLNVRVEIAATGATAAVIDLELNGNTNSYLQLLQMDSIFAGQIT